jgi:hypothetical protein
MEPKEFLYRALDVLQAHPDAETIVCFPDGEIFLPSSDNAIKEHARVTKQKYFVIERGQEDTIAEAIENGAFKHEVTQEDLDNNPELVDGGVKVGEEIEVPIEGVTETPEPKTETVAAENAQTEAPVTTTENAAAEKVKTEAPAAKKVTTKKQGK